MTELFLIAPEVQKHGR